MDSALRENDKLMEAMFRRWHKSLFRYVLDPTRGQAFSFGRC